MPVRLGPPQLLAAHGTPVLLGIITATGATATTNASTATPFSHTGDALKGKTLLICPDYDCYLVFGETSSVSVTALTGVEMIIGDKMIVHMSARHGWLGAIPWTPETTTNVRVFELV